MKGIHSVLLIISISAAISMPSSGQTRFGIAGGINWASFGDADFGSAAAAYESKAGWHLGLFADLKILVVGVRPGLYYVNAGPLFEGGFEDSQQQEALARCIACLLESQDEDLTSFNVTYVSLPIDVKFGFPLPMLEPYLFLGPEFKFSTVSEDDGELADQMESTVVAGNVGLGVGLGLGGNVTLYPEFRFGFDISGFFGDSVTLGNEEITTDKHTASVFVARLGVGL